MEESIHTNKNKGTSNIIIPFAIAIVGLAIVGLFFFKGADQNNLSGSISTTSAPVAPTTTEQTTSVYKDGEYEAVGEYTSPGGHENIGVTVTLKDGVIVSSVVEPKATRPNSVRFQGIFKANYQAQVDGKNIDEVKLDKVSGSSLSPKGFNDALEQIKSEART